MSDTQSHYTSPTFAGTASGAPLASRSLMDHPAMRWARAKLFNTWPNTVVTLIFAYFILKVIISVISWGVINAVWSVPGTNTQACRAVAGVGACWALIHEKFRFIMFGTYPYEEHWRPALVIVIFLALYGLSAMRRLWNGNLVWIWIGGLTLIGILMWGGIFGMRFVEQERWGGLPITLILATFGIALAFPLSIVMALGRRSHMPAVKVICVTYIELIRGVPLISLLFMASVMFPLFLPEGLTIDKLLRAQVAIILFAAAYLAEVIRGGLQAIPKGQYEAADSLGLAFWQKTSFIILPQALRMVIPPLVNTFIGMFKDTSLVLIIGIFDLLNSAKTAVNEPAWRGFGLEAYVFVGLIYFLFCFAMSKYSQDLEAELSRGHKR
jgi:general L-amino acid transport system permease protein